MSKTLSAPAIQIINEYLAISVGNATCAAPYFNNHTRGTRGGLAVQAGKGSAKELTEEAEILVKKNHTDVATLTNDTLQQLLVDHGLGVDCSGFTYHVLNAEVKHRTGKSLAKHIAFPFIKNPLRKLLAKRNPVTRTGTKSLAHETNSKEININDIAAGDMIIMLDYEKNRPSDHVMVVEKIETTANNIITHYVHSLAWNTDGKYNHGVRRGTITVSDPGKRLTSAVWEEQKKTGAQNQTLQNAKNATYLGIRRLNALSTC